MAKLVLGKTPEDVEREEAQKERELEKQIIEQNDLRQKKLSDLYQKQKRNKTIVILCAILVFTILVVFGVKNTFFHKGLQMDEVNTQLAKYINPLYFPENGMEGYIKNNVENMLAKYISTNNQTVKIDPTTCAITWVTRLNRTNSRVYFTVDISTKAKDIIVSDETTITELKNRGLTNNTTVNITIDNKIVTYYMERDTVYQVGETTTKKYCFQVIIVHDYQYVNDVPVTSGYALGSEVSLYSLVDTDQVDFTKVNKSDYLKFPEKSEVTDTELARIQIKVDKTLGDLYALRDTSQDFFNARQFETYGASYAGIEYIEVHGQTNALGYNALVRYKIITQQGFMCTIESYMLIVKDGNSYVIKDYM